MCLGAVVFMSSGTQYDALADTSVGPYFTLSRYLSSYHSVKDDEVPQQASNGYEAVPAVVTMKDVFITPQGFVLSRQASETKTTTT